MGTVMHSFKNKMYVGFIAAFLLSAISGYTSYLSFKKQADLSNELTHCYKIVNTTQNVMKLVTDLETGQRGYRITNEKAFLQPYYDGVPHIGPAIEELKKLVSDNPQQTNNAALLEQNINQLLHFWKTETGNSVGYANEFTTITTANEKQQMDKIRSNIYNILQLENRLLIETNNSNNKSIKYAIRISYVDTTLTLAIISILITLIIIELNKRRSAMGQLEQSNIEIKESKIALEQSEANLRLIVDLLPQSVFVKDYNGKFIFINKNFASLYGLSQKDLVNKSFSEVIPVKSEAAAFLEQDREVILSGETKIIPEHPFTDHKGAVRIFHILKVPFTVAGTNEKALLGMIIDITEQKTAEAERAKIIADVVRRNNDLEQFSYIVSHDLRSPVANILGLVNIIQSVGIDSGEEMKVTGYLVAAAQNLDAVIKDINHILDLKHTGNETKERILFDTLLDTVKLSISNMINNDQVEIISDFSEAEDIVSIRSYLYSIFLNLVSNSIKYKRPGIKPIIEIISVKIENKIQLIFKDNALGIDLKNKKDEIFGLYKRFHDHVDGKGMGLFMVKTQVESLGGKIMITSEVNKGSEFRIEFEMDDITIK